MKEIEKINTLHDHVGFIKSHINSNSSSDNNNNTCGKAGLKKCWSAATQL